MSNLLEQASLVLVPSGIKASKVYSEIPIDGSGDLTFARNSDSTRVNSLGLVEKVRTNLLSYSEDFGNAYYTKNRSSITTNTTTAPNGTTTADSLIESTANGTHEFILVIAVVQQAYTFSIYSKANTRNKIQLVLAGTPFASGGNGEVSFDLSTGSIISAVNGATGKIESVGSGWYRCSITKLASVADPSGVFAVRLLDSSGNSSYTGDGTSFAYFWGAQFELSDFGPTAYIPTTSSAVSVGPYSNIPRLNYQNGGGGCPSLLLEAQRTNLQVYSEQFNLWSNTNAITISTNQTTSPDGYINADKLIETSADDFHIVGQTTTLTGSTSYTFSIYAKASERSILRMLAGAGAFNDQYAYFNLADGTSIVNSVGTATMQSVGNGWYKCIWTLSTIASPSTGVAMWVGPSPNMSEAYTTYTGDNTKGIFVWGAQLEAGSYVSSYIPTLGTSVTRVADACYKTSASGLIGQTEGVVFVDFNLPSIETDVNYPFIIDLYNDNSNRFGFARYPNGGIHIYMIASGSSQFTYNTTQLTGDFKLALGYKNNDCVVYLNGSLLHTVTSASIPTTNVIALNAINEFGSYNTQQLIKQVVLFPTRLTNSQLAELTA